MKIKTGSYSESVFALSGFSGRLTIMAVFLLMAVFGIAYG